MKHILTASALLLIPITARADDWPQWLGPKRDGTSSEVIKPWKDPLKVVWSQPVGKKSKAIEGHGSPVVAKGKVYLHYGTRGKFEEIVAAFDADTGKPVWSKTYPRAKAAFPFGNDPRGSPLVADGKVYTFGITGILSCWNADDGAMQWQVDTAKEYKSPSLTFGSSSSPIVVDDLVLVNVGAKGASIVAFNKNTGREVWKKLDDGATYSSPIVHGSGENKQIIFLTAKGLVGLSPKDGSVFWQHPLVDLILESSTTPVIAGEILFGTSITFGGLGLQMIEDKGKPAAKKLWQNSNLNCYFATPVVVGKDTFYMVTGSLIAKSATLQCVDATSGKILWSRPKVGAYHASLVRTGDDKLLFIEEAGNFVLIEPNREKYVELARTNGVCGATWVHPALANGRVYIRDDENLICVAMPK